jgi:hypothetical protein
LSRCAAGSARTRLPPAHPGCLLPFDTCSFALVRAALGLVRPAVPATWRKMQSTAATEKCEGPLSGPDTEPRPGAVASHARVIRQRPDRHSIENAYETRTSFKSGTHPSLQDASEYRRLPGGRPLGSMDRVDDTSERNRYPRFGKRTNLLHATGALGTRAGTGCPPGPHVRPTA